MKRFSWLHKQRRATDLAASAARPVAKLPRGQRRAAGRRPSFESLEDRRVFAVGVSISLDSVAENAGGVPAVVSRTGSLTQPLTVSLSSSDTTEATVPASIVIPANASTTLFHVTVVNDAALDARATVTITASAVGHGIGTDSIAITNDDRLALPPASTADSVTLAPGAQAGQYQATLGPTRAATLGDPHYVAFAGQSPYQTAGANLSVQADQFLPVDLSKTYALTGWARSGDEFGQRYQSANRQSFGFASYDADLLPILSQLVMKFAGATDTTLAAPLNPGATTMTLVNAAGWSRAAGAASESRGLAWYGYQNSHGTTYANYTYTRNVALGGANGLWAPGAINGNVITLAAPWSGPALPAGTAVRNTDAGDDENYVALNSQPIPNDWTFTHYAGVFRNQMENGKYAASTFRPGTAFIKPIIIANEHGATDNFISWRDVAVTEVPTGTTAAALARPPIDLSVNLAGDQRQSLPVGSTHADRLVKINASSRYTLSSVGTRALEQNERVFGFASYDVDKKLIHPLHVTRHAYAIDTRLAAALAPGATSLLITNASGWSNEPWEPAETRSLAWYGYADSTGHTYADYTYTRNVAFNLDNGLWAPGAIHYDSAAGAYRIQLSKPWSGPALPAGAAIRNAASGDSLNLAGEAQPFALASAWTSHTATVGGGVWQQGRRDETTFRPGTVYIQPAFTRASQAGHVIVGPVEDAIFGGPLDPTQQSAEANAAQQVSLDLDVLLKTGLGDGTIVIDSVAAPTFGTATIVPAAPGGRAVINYLSTSSFMGTDVVQYTLRNTSTNQTAKLSTTIHILGRTPEALGALPTRIFDPTYEIAAGQTLNADGIDALSLVADAIGTPNTTVRLVAGPSHGSLRVNPNGTFRYTPAAGFTGADTFRIEALTTTGVTTVTASIKVHQSTDELVQGRLKEIALGIHNYESARGRFPIIGTTATHFNASGIPHLSWRVHILPYIGYQSLYAQFRLNEPWNSAHNTPLAAQMPDIFRSGGDSAASTTTRFQTISAEGAPYYWRRSGNLLVGPTHANFSDGLDNSLLIVERGANKAITWTQPEARDFLANNSLASLGTITSDRINAVTADAKPIALPATIDAATFKSLVTISGGETLDVGTLRRQAAEANGAAAAYSFGASASDAYFRQLALAMLNFESAQKLFPVATGFDANGQPLLSWRVHLLPFLGYTNLYSQFNLQQAWNSPTNLPLLSKMPDIFRSAGDPSSSTSTRVVTFTGPDAPFNSRSSGNQLGPRQSEFTDGTSNTILFLEARPNRAVPWTKPEDVPLNVNNPLAALGDLSSGEIRAAMADGSVIKLPTDIAPADFAALATLRGGETVARGSLVDRELARAGRAEPPALVNNFRQISLAMLNHESATSRFPVSRFSATGQPLLSWRVLILPYIEQGALYAKFNLNEPWDSPHNLALLDEMPDFFRSHGDPWDSTTTRVMQFTGPGAPFTGTTGTGPRVNSIIDGLSNTISFVEAGPNSAVPWTKPVDLPFNRNNPFSPLGELGPYLVAAFFDAHIQPQLSSISIDLLSALITHNADDFAAPPIPNVPAVTIHQTAGTTATHEFGVDTFDVVLDKRPLTSVVLAVSLSNTAVAALDRTTVAFTPENWNIPQRVALRAVDDRAASSDRTVDVTIAVVDELSDNAYDPLASHVFTALIQNVAAPQPPDADFNNDSRTNGRDFLAWQRNHGIAAGALHTQGDANNDGAVGPPDLAAWQTQFGAGAAAAPAMVHTAADLNGPSGVFYLSPAPHSTISAAHTGLAVTSDQHASEHDTAPARQAATTARDDVFAQLTRFPRADAEPAGDIAAPARKSPVSAIDDMSDDEVWPEWSEPLLRR